MADDGRTAAADGTPAATAKGESKRIALSRRGQSAGRRAAESKATIPHLYTSRTVQLQDGAPADLTPTVIAALGRALREQPALNSAYRDGELEIHSRINIGLTVETDEGPLLPTLFDADKKGMEELRTEIDALRGRIASGEITSPELAGGTVALTAVPQGADSVMPSVIPGQAAHLGVGRSRDEPVLLDGVPAAGRTVDLTVSCDQRAAGPEASAALLERLAALLATPTPPTV
ncbi:MAG: 2-oxo acid dehydrogenase subunit E2 [Solirubrobacterales bacterium]